jgi:hypothetical protein
LSTVEDGAVDDPDSDADPPDLYCDAMDVDMDDEMDDSSGRESGTGSDESSDSGDNGEDVIGKGTKSKTNKVCPPFSCTFLLPSDRPTGPIIGDVGIP